MHKLLYVEDDEALAFVTKRALTRLGYEVHHYLDIESAKTAFANEPFDGALLDLKLGNETSLGLLRDICTATDIPVVLLTGYGSIRTAVQAMKLGAINYLSKPCTVNEIVNALNDRNVLPEEPASTEIETLSLRGVEWEAIQKALDENNGNISATARQLKMHRRTLQRKLQKRNI